MCQGRNCKLRDKCYRYTAPESLVWQTWADFDDSKEITTKCESFWDNEGRYNAKTGEDIPNPNQERLFENVNEMQGRKLPKEEKMSQIHDEN